MRVKGTISQEILYALSSLGNFSLPMRRSHGLWDELNRQMKIISAEERTVKDAFYYLKKKGLIAGELRDGQLYIRLTPEGEKEAGRYQINRLKIRAQKQWDKKWRLLIFDIPEARRVKREALRGKLKELGFYPLQKSVWVIPFPCEREVKLLREFFNLKPKEIRVFETAKLEEDQFLKDIFKLESSKTA
jgi:DNA-binding transcriptional regulator PaaX